MGNRTLRLAMLEVIGKAICSTCNKVLDMNYYHKSNVNTSGIRYVCKVCLSTDETNRAYHRAYNKIHYSNNKAYYYSKKQVRRSKQLIATTKFGQEGIIDFYNNRPEGMHIDHIIPLNSKVVCGLHNIYNLQYLSAEDNLRKGNSFEV